MKTSILVKKLEILSVDSEGSGQHKLPGGQTGIETLRRGPASGQWAGRHGPHNKLARNSRRQAALTRVVRLVALLENGLDQPAQDKLKNFMQCNLNKKISTNFFKTIYSQRSYFSKILQHNNSKQLQKNLSIQCFGSGSKLGI